MPDFIDIHTHTFYTQENTRLLLNVFPPETEKLNHPCYFSVGLHPWHVKKETLHARLDWIKDHAADPRVLAIGETGLDKAIAVPWEDQVLAFETQISLAVHLQKPVILHCVRAYNEMIVYRTATGRKHPWIFHWFNGSKEIADELIRKNCYLSFGHMLFNQKSKAFRVFSTLPPGSVFLETDDAGFSIQEIYERAALLKNMTVDELIVQINRNFADCFGL